MLRLVTGMGRLAGHERAASGGGAPIVGRERELSAIDRALARAGRGDVLLIAGEPGIGKSAIADTLLARAQASGRATASGRSWEAGGAPPFWPWVQVLRALSRKSGPLEPGDLIERLSAGARVEIAAASSMLSAGPSADRFALFDTVTRALEAASEKVPLAIVLEDVHTADLPTLGLFEHAARELRAAPILLAATYRDVEAHAQPEVDAALTRVCRHAEVLHLKRLDRAAVQDLVAQALGPRSSEEVARFYATTGGNPLFVRELLRVLEADGAALDDERPPRSDGLRAAIREHLRHLGPVRSVLDAASVLGRDVSVQAVVALLEGGEAQRAYVEGALHRAVERGVLVEDAAEHYRFVHVLLRDTLHADLEPRRRAELHVRYARWLRGSPANRSEIAHHLLAAGPEHVIEAADAAHLAAEEAMHGLAFEHAAELCERALDALDIARAAAPELRFRLLKGLGLAKIHSGDLAAGKRTCARAAELARAERDPIRLAQAALAYGSAFVFGAVDPVLVGLCEESLRGLPESELELRARVMARLAAAMQPSEDTAPPIALAREAMALGAQADERVQLAVNFAAMSAMMDIVDPRERAPLNEQMIKLAKKLDEPTMALHAQRRLIVDRLDLGEVQVAKALIHDYAEASREITQRHMRWQLPLFRSSIALLEGRFAEHEQYVAEARQITAPLGVGAHQLGLAMHCMAAERIRDRNDELRAAFQVMRQYVPPVPIYADLLEAAVIARCGDTTTARALLTRNDPELLVTYDDITMDLIASEVAVAANDLKWARTLKRAIGTHLHEACSWGLIGFATEAPALQPMAMICALLGDWDEARQHFAEALLWTRRTGAEPVECRLRVGWAERLAAHGEQDAAQEHAEGALAIAARLELPALLGRAQRLLTASPSPARASRVTEPCCTIVQRGDLWTLTWNGKVCQLKDSRGLAFLARLLDEPGREVHALDLVGAPDETRFEDGGELLDAEARDAYRRRLRVLQDDIEEAREAHDAVRAEHLEAEHEALQREIARGVGLGGRARKASTAAEKARVNVQRRIADTLRRIREQDAGLAEHLETCVRTGIYCLYEPRRSR